MAEHRIFESEHAMASTNATVRYRAFCRCGWMSAPTYDEAAHRLVVAEHAARALEASPAAQR